MVAPNLGGMMTGVVQKNAALIGMTNPQTLEGPKVLPSRNLSGLQQYRSHPTLGDALYAKACKRGKQRSLRKFPVT